MSADRDILIIRQTLQNVKGCGPRRLYRPQLWSRPGDGQPVLSHEHRYPHHGLAAPRRTEPPQPYP